MAVSQVGRLKELEEENRKLKHMYADLALNNRILKEVIEKTLKADVCKEMEEELVYEYDICISWACRLMNTYR